MANDRVISISGIVFAVATFAGLVLLLEGAAAGDDTNEEAARWLNDSGNRTQMLIGMYVMSGGAVAFLLFATALLRRLRTANAPGFAVELAQVSGVAFAVLTLVAALGMGLAALAVAAGNEPTPVDPGAARITTYGFSIWALPACFAASAFVATVSVAAISSGAFPRWLGLLGLLIAVLLLFGIAFLPSLAVMVWAALVSIVTFVRPAGAAALRPTEAPA
jgi:hypothetical protein